MIETIGLIVCARLFTPLAILMLPAMALPEESAAVDMYRQGYNAILREEWQEAERLLNEFSSTYPESAWADDSAFWTCYAKDKGRLSLEASFNCYLTFVNKWPRSEWQDDALRNLAILGKRLARNGKPEYLARVEALERGHRRGGPDEEEIYDLLTSLEDLSSQRALDILLRYLETSKSESLRSRLVLLLENYPSPQTSKVLLDLVHHDTSTRVRENAVEVLLDWEFPALIDPLKKIAADSSYPTKLRREIIENMADSEIEGRVGFLEELIAQESNRDILNEALEALGDMEEPAANQLLFDIVRTSEDSYKQKAALEAMGDTESPEALAFLTQMAIENNQPELTEMAVQAIENFGERKAIDALTHIASSVSDWRTKVAVAYTLGEFESPNAVIQLMDLFEKEADYQVRRAVIKALGETEQARAVAFLANLINTSDDPQIRSEAIDSLRQLRDLPEAREALLNILERRLKSNTTKE